MRKVIVSEFVTLDGVMEDPGGAEKSKYGGWTWPYMEEAIGKFKLEEMMASDALLLGRLTYEAFAEAWPSRTDAMGFAERMNNVPKYVASTTLTKLAWNNSHLLQGDIAAAVTKLKQEPGRDILVAGSGMLVRALMQHDLVDEYRLLVYPVTLGTGKKLFGDGSHASLKLMDAQPFKSGVVRLTYHPAPPPDPKTS
jgi:dihydrofolate reductase